MSAYQGKVDTILGKGKEREGGEVRGGRRCTVAPHCHSRTHCDPRQNHRRHRRPGYGEGTGRRLRRLRRLRRRGELPVPHRPGHRRGRRDAYAPAAAAASPEIEDILSTYKKKVGEIMNKSTERLGDFLPPEPVLAVGDRIADDEKSEFDPEAAVDPLEEYYSDEESGGSRRSADEDGSGRRDSYGSGSYDSGGSRSYEDGRGGSVHSGDYGSQADDVDEGYDSHSSGRDSRGNRRSYRSSDLSYAIARSWGRSTACAGSNDVCRAHRERGRRA